VNKNRPILSDVTNNIKKNLIEIFKSNIKKKGKINQGEIHEGNGLIQKRENEENIASLKHRKLNRIKKEL
jgi:hypothetical protein